jgi:hypothetical protein
MENISIKGSYRIKYGKILKNNEKPYQAKKGKIS